jgi:DNA-binding PadR family transcriptional regulator
MFEQAHEAFAKHANHADSRHHDQWPGRPHHHRPDGDFPHGFRDPRGMGRIFRAAGFGARQQARRGDVRAAILALLSEQPMHGYQVMQELASRSGGAWAPSAGSIYPTLQQLEDEGLVQGADQDGRRVYTLTEAGRAAAGDAVKSAPWKVTDDPEGQDLRGIFIQVAQAAMQVNQVGSPAQVAEAARILTGARRDLYGLLAQDPQSQPDPAAPATPEPDPQV